jgi:hypothetical protein
MKGMQCDHVQQFVSNILNEVCQYFNISLSLSTAYRPNVQGQIERFHRTLLDGLAKLTQDYPDSWDKHVQSVIWAYRSFPQCSTSYSPYYLVFGKTPLSPLDLALKPRNQKIAKSAREHIAKITEELEYVRNLANEHLSHVRTKMKTKYDEEMFDPEFQVGDLVYIFVPAMKGPHANRKLFSPWSGPYCLIEQCSPTHFKLRRCKDNVTLKIKYISTV